MTWLDLTVDETFKFIQWVVHNQNESKRAYKPDSKKYLRKDRNCFSELYKLILIFSVYVFIIFLPLILLLWTRLTHITNWIATFSFYVDQHSSSSFTDEMINSVNLQSRCPLFAFATSYSESVKIWVLRWTSLKLFKNN